MNGSLEITFDEALANHKSYISADQPDGYTPWLLEVGWKTKLDSTLNRDHFTRFKGTNFITHAIEKFNKSNKHGLIVEAYHNGQNITDKNWNYGK
jgi:hypothetical protein